MGPQAGQDDPSAPILVIVRVLGEERTPIAGARVEMQVFDAPHPLLGEPGALVHTTYTADMDGMFVVHLEPTPRLRTLAQVHGGRIDFQIFAVFPDGVFPWGLTRELGSDAWAGEPVTMDILPEYIRESWPEFVPSPQPAGT